MQVETGNPTYEDEVSGCVRSSPWSRLSASINFAMPTAVSSSAPISCVLGYSAVHERDRLVKSAVWRRGWQR